jgi:tyrosyl-tRNA synthetase
VPLLWRACSAGHIPSPGRRRDDNGRRSGSRRQAPLMTREMIEANVAAIKKQLAQFLDFEIKANPARVMNNAEWLLELNLVNFLRDVGKHFTINTMITKESVRTRLEREDGISFTEFSYMLLQSYDYLHLFQTENCLMRPVDQMVIMCVS